MVVNLVMGEEIIIELIRVVIYGSWKENLYLDLIYIVYFMNIKDLNKRKVWVYGLWDVMSGGRFDYLWNESIYVVELFEILKGWLVDRLYDWGEFKFFSNLWFVELDGREVEIEGKCIKYFCGSIFVIGELYGCLLDEFNIGFKMSVINVVKMVKWVDDRFIGNEVEMFINY